MCLRLVLGGQWWCRERGCRDEGAGGWWAGVVHGLIGLGGLDGRRVRGDTRCWGGVGFRAGGVVG